MNRGTGGVGRGGQRSPLCSPASIHPLMEKVMSDFAVFFPLFSPHFFGGMRLLSSFSPSSSLFSSVLQHTLLLAATLLLYCQRHVPG